jgi:hypothetical protein
VIVGHAHGARELSIVDVGVSFDHAQRGPSADCLHGSQRYAVGDHHGGTSVSEGVMADAGRAQSAQCTRKRHAGGFLRRRHAIRSQSENEPVCIAAGQQIRT